MTYQDSEHKDSGDRPSPSDIKITPAMLAAGVDAFAGYNRKFMMDEDIVTLVYQAMAAAK